MKKVVIDSRYERLLREQHPNLKGVPDYGLVLEPAVEAEFRQRAEKNGVDLDFLKAQFELSNQVIPAQSNEKLIPILLKHNIIPLNAVKNCFGGRLDMAILSKTHPTFQQTQTS